MSSPDKKPESSSGSRAGGIPTPSGPDSDSDSDGPSNLETMDQTLNVEPGTWSYPTNPDICCIYRVPNCMRHVNPEAYTPQLVLIGPLHHYLISQAHKSREDITNTKSMGYLNMERHKKIYLEEFSKRENVGGTQSIERLRRVIQEEEDMIRSSYSESTDWIESREFVEMILHDSVFILEHILRYTRMWVHGYKKIGDPLMDEPCLHVTVKRDLMLLENQLPYFILHKLFHLLYPRLRALVTSYFFDGKGIKDESKFSHFTDLFRCIRVETLPDRFLGHFADVDDMYHADKLYSGGIKFNVVDKVHSLEVEFKNGCLNIPSFYVDDHMETTLRNIMALEQCHYAYNTHVCNYIWFLDFLIDSDKDVELLVAKGIIKNLLGNHGSVARMVNRFCLGVTSFGSYYSVIALDVKNHYNNRWNKSRAVLKSVYFSNPWRGTATVAAALLLVLTLVQTVSSIIQIS